ncbi:MAG: flavin reductase family protein [Janthinobacterium lividum]
MRKIPLHTAFTLIEPSPVVLITTTDGMKDNIMTLSWISVVNYIPQFVITTGAWNHSFKALRKTRECVIAIPTVDMLDKVVGIGTCSGADTDKFQRFGLTARKARHVAAPRIAECLANIECRVVDVIRKHDLMILEGVAAYVDTTCKERRTLHAVGDGSFIVDGKRLDRRKQMISRLAPGV